MRQLYDADLRGYGSFYDSAEDMLASAQANRGRRTYPAFSRGGWTGMDLRSWDDARAKLNSPWPEGREKVATVMSEIAEAKLPSPVSKARKQRWSEDDGEVSSDRVLAGESEYYRETYRASKTGTQNVTVLTNYGGVASHSSESLFWSSAAAIAVVDLLEEAGYSCEIWAYNWSTRAFDNGADFFSAIHLKEAGNPLDIESLMTVTSGWWFRTVGLSVFDDVPGQASSGGYGSTVGRIGKWIKHIDTVNSLVITMDGAYSKTSAIDSAKKLVESVINQESEY